MDKGIIGPLVVIGGHEAKGGETTILEEFVRLAGGSKAKIVVMPVATDEPDEYAKRLFEK